MTSGLKNSREFIVAGTRVVVFVPSLQERYLFTECCPSCSLFSFIFFFSSTFRARDLKSGGVFGNLYQGVVIVYTDGLLWFRVHIVFLPFSISYDFGLQFRRRRWNCPRGRFVYNTPLFFLLFW